MQYSFHGKKECVINFTFVVVCYYLIFFKYASLCSLIKLANILRKLHKLLNISRSKGAATFLKGSIK